MRSLVRCRARPIAQQYPSKPVKIIIPFPAGGVTDIAGRLIAQKLSERLGQQFYIENVAGAGGNLGMGQVARAPGDGYTILFASSSIVVNPSLYNKMPFDVEKDFIPVTKAGAIAELLAGQSEFPGEDDEGAGRPHQEGARQAQRRVARRGHHAVAVDRDAQASTLELDFVTVPFAGGGPMIQSLLGGHTPIACGAIGNTMTLIKEGKIRALAITANKRLEVVPELPTLDELGIKDQEAETMTGVFVPAGTPKPIVDLLQKEICGDRELARHQARLLELGIVPEGNSSAALRRLRQGRGRQVEEGDRGRQDSEDLDRHALDDTRVTTAEPCASSTSARPRSRSSRTCATPASISPR